MVDLPEGWNKTIKDVSTNERPGKIINPQEYEWARVYERNLLRQWARFPKDGEVYEATEAVEIAAVIYWRAPFTDARRSVIPQGTRIRVIVQDPEPVGVYAIALEPDAVEALVIPQDYRSDPKYDGYCLSVRTEELNQHFAWWATMPPYNSRLEQTPAVCGPALLSRKSVNRTGLAAREPLACYP